MPSPRNSTLTVRAPSSPNDYRQRIINLVAMHEPSKLGTLNVALSHFQGREEKLLSTLSTRLGSEPTPQEVTELAEHMKSFPPTSPRAKDSTTPRVSPTSPRAKLLQTRVVNLYRKYQPDRLKEIKSILAAIAGREEQALQMLVKKYGPEPTQEEISAMPPVTPRLNATTPQSRFASPRVSVTSTSTPHTTIQQRIKNILLKYDREKVDQINFESEKIRGHEEQILNTLVLKYGPEPTLAEVVVLEQQAKDNSSSEYQMYRTRVSSMLRRYNPSKLGTEDTILSMYRGKEEELLRSMIAKYGPEPSAESNATPAPSASSTPGPKSSWQSTSALKSPRSRPLSPQVDSVNFSQLVVTVPHGLESNNNSRITSPQDLPICTNIFSNADQHPNFRARVGNMYIKYAPQKLTDLSHDVLKHIGREEVHMKELVAQYGPEPSEAEILGIISAPGNYQNRILRMYQTYNAHKMEEAKDLVVSNCGREAELMHSLILSYGPEPSDSTLSTSVYKENPATPLPFTIEELENQSSGSNEHRALDFRTRITNIYLRYCPLKLGTVDEMVQRTPRGAEEALILELVRKYGPEPHEAEIKNLKAIPGNTSQLYQGVMPLSPARRKNYRSILYNYCIVHEPKNIPRIDETLAQFIGQEDVLMRNLFIKYGPEPSADEVAKAKNACSSTSVQDLSKYRERLVRFYKKYDPSMESSIDEVMHKYLGREDELMMTLLARYGPEPVEITQPVQDYPSEKAPASIVVHGPDIKTRVMHMFMRYDPERLPCVESIMGQYVGKEDEIIKHLVNVYGPEPSVGDVAWHVFLAANDRDKSESKSSLGNGSAKTVEDKMDLRTCMNNFCVRYDPDLIALMDDMFSQYAKQFEERVQSLFSPKEAHDPKQDTNTESVTGTISVDAYRRRLRNFFIKYAPDRVGTEDEVLRAHEGCEEGMIRNLVVRFGPEPSDGEVACMKLLASDDIRRRIEDMYLFYEPQKLVQMDAILRNFVGAEESLLRALVTNYGPEPKAGELACLMLPKQNTQSEKAFVDSHRTRLRRFLEKYDSLRVLEIDSMLKEYAGAEDRLFRSLTIRYGPEPSSACVTPEFKETEIPATSQFSALPAVARSETPAPSAPCENSILSGNTPAPSPVEPESVEYRTRVATFLSHYDPENLTCVDTLMETFQGFEENLMQQLVERYGPEPSSSVNTIAVPPANAKTTPSPVLTGHLPDKSAHRTRVMNFLAKYDPENLSAVDNILTIYAGHEEYILRELALRYGPEPTDQEIQELLKNALRACQSTNVTNRLVVSDATREGSDYRTKLYALYSKYEPERMPFIDQDLNEYRGREQQFLDWLQMVYESSHTGGNGTKEVVVL